MIWYDLDLHLKTGRQAVSLIYDVYQKELNILNVNELRKTEIEVRL